MFARALFATRQIHQMLILLHEYTLFNMATSLFRLRFPSLRYAFVALRVVMLAHII